MIGNNSDNHISSPFWGEYYRSYFTIYLVTSICLSAIVSLIEASLCLAHVQGIK